MSDSDGGVQQINLDTPNKSPANSRDFKMKRLARSLKVVETDEEIEFRNYYNGLNVIKSFPHLIKCTKCMHSFKSDISEGKKIYTHPILQVLMCERCCLFYGNGEFSLDEDDEDKYCRWCGEGGKIFLCSECICGFCPTCIKKHYGKQKVREIEKDDEWLCFICNPKPLWKLRAVCRLAVEQSVMNKSKNDNSECEIPKKKILNLRNSKQHTLTENVSCETGRKKGNPNNEDSSTSSKGIQKDCTKLANNNRKRFHTSKSQGKDPKTSGIEQSDGGEEPPKKMKSACVKSKDKIRADQSKSNSGGGDLTVSSPSSDSSDDETENNSLGELNNREAPLDSRKKNKNLDKLKDIFTIAETVSELCLKTCRKKIKKLDKNLMSNEKLMTECEKLRSMIILMSCSLSTAHNMVVSLQQKSKIKEQLDLPLPGKQESTLMEAFGKILRDKKMKTSCFSHVVSEILNRYPFIELGAKNFFNYLRNMVYMDSALEFIKNFTNTEIAENLERDDTKGRDTNTTEGSSAQEKSETNAPTNFVKPDSNQIVSRKNKPPRVSPSVVKTNSLTPTPSPSNVSGASSSSGKSESKTCGLKDDFMVSSDEISAEDEQLKAGNLVCAGTLNTITQRAKEGVLVDNPGTTKEKREIARLMKLRILEKSRKRVNSGTDPVEKSHSKDEKLKEPNSMKSKCDPPAPCANESFSDSQMQTEVPPEDTSYVEENFSLPHPSITQRNIENGHTSMARGYFIQTSSSNEGPEDSNCDEKSKKTKCPARGTVIILRRDVEKEKSKWRSDTVLRSSISFPEPKSDGDKKDKSNCGNDSLLRSSISAPEPKSDGDKLELEGSTKNSDDEEEGIDSDSTVNSLIFDYHLKRKRKITALSSSPESDVEELPEPTDSNVESPPKGRRNIKKIVKTGNLQLETRQAVKAENERKKRVAERKRIYEESFPKKVKRERVVLDFDLDTKEILLEVPQEIAKKLKPHQKEGVKFMWDCCFESLDSLEKTNGSGCVLAHCMGLGKTLQVISLIFTIMKNGIGIKTVLILCPLNVVNNWIDEFNNWLKDCDFKVDAVNLSNVKGDRSKVAYLEKWHKEGGVTIVSYDLIKNLANPKRKTKTDAAKPPRFSELLLDPGPDVVVCDEGHLLKNQGTVLSKCISKINTSRRILLTGTPLQNNLIEYHSMVHFIKPNILGTRMEFINRFVNPIMNGQFGDSTAKDVKLMRARSHVLHKLLDGCIQRQSYSVLTPYLPEKYEYVVSIRLTEPQVKLYRHYLGKCRRTFISDKAAKLFSDFHLLQRIWTHPRLLISYIENECNDDYDFDENNLKPPSSEDSIICMDTDDNGMVSSVVTVKDLITNELLGDIQSSGKLVLLLHILTGCKKVGDKVLVFSQSLRNLNLIEYFLRKINSAYESASTDFPAQYRDSWVKGMDYYRMEGSTSNEARAKWCKSFNNMENKRLRLFLISTKAGGLGLNLIGANRVIVFDVSWNPSHDVQSIFRVYRFGQLKTCYIYRFVTEGTMEEKIYARQVTKLSLEKRIMDELQIERHYTMGNLQELYAYDPTPKEKWKVPLVPKDIVLAEIINNKNLIASYFVHDTLLEDKEEEELTEEERKAAWDDFEKEKFMPENDINGMNNAYNYPSSSSLNTLVPPNMLQAPSARTSSENPNNFTVAYLRNTYFRRDNNFNSRLPFVPPNPYIGNYTNFP